jgi:threonine/homoserine/homoserine lactone efflux protein
VIASIGPALGSLLPAAVAIALSPIPIVAIVLVLDGPHARARGCAFAAGWLAGLLVTTILAVTILGNASQSGSAEQSRVQWLDVIIGLVFFALAYQQWHKRPRAGEEPKEPKWMATLGSLTPARAVGLGVALSSINPKNLALVLAGAGAIAQAELEGSDEAVAIAVFVAVASVVVVGCVALYVTDAQRAAGPLDAMRRFMAEHNAAIMIVVLLLLGAKFLGDGLGGLTA